MKDDVTPAFGPDLRCLKLMLLISVNVTAFHAQGRKTEDIHPKSIIKFGNVKMNVGGCYNPMLSVFTCADNGLYLFYVTISANGKAVWYEMVQDGVQRLLGYTGSSASTHFAMIRCHPKSHVWVKQGPYQPSSKQGMYGSHSQFGGFKIA